MELCYPNPVTSRILQLGVFLFCGPLCAMDYGFDFPDHSYRPACKKAVKKASSAKTGKQKQSVSTADKRNFIKEQIQEELISSYQEDGKEIYGLRVLEAAPNSREDLYSEMRVMGINENFNGPLYSSTIARMTVLGAEVSRALQLSFGAEDSSHGVILSSNHVLPHNFGAALDLNPPFNVFGDLDTLYQIYKEGLIGRAQLTILDLDFD